MAEDDASSLSMSFLLVLCFRFALSGVLPLVEEEPLVATARLPMWEWRVFGLYIVGAVFASFAILMVFIVVRFQNNKDLDRIFSTVMNAAAMSFAWCMLYATRWLANHVPWLYQMPSLMGRVLIALQLSLFVAFAVFALDYVDDMHQGDEDSKAGSQALRTLISALGILVGFSWESCFEYGIEALATRSPHPVLTELCLVIILCAFMIPAWRKYILNRVMRLQKLKETREDRALAQRDAEARTTE